MGVETTAEARVTEVRLRNVEPDVLNVIRELARRRHRTMEQFLKDELAALADREKTAMLAQLRRTRDELRAAHGDGPDSTDGIRAEREARW